MSKIIIIGNGIAGSSAARHIRKGSDFDITMISGETDFPFSRTALMYIFMGHMKFEHTVLYEKGFWAKNRINAIRAWVTHIDKNQKNITLDNGDVLSYDILILATGSKYNTPAWKGVEAEGVQGLYHIQDLERMEKAASKGIRRAVIVGGGLIGIEMAEMLHSRHIPVTMIVRESGYGSNILPREESEMVSAHIRAHGIEILLNEELGEIRQKDGRVSSVLCQHSGREIECDFVGLTVGVSPQVEWVKHSGILLNKGIVVDEYLRTSDPDIYAIGDCAEINNPQPGRRPVEAVWYTGRLMGETVAKTICGQPTPYNPGIWFNSAKYFDIEYQVYGDIPIQLPDFITSLYWQHPTENKAIRIHYHTETGAVTGFNLMGIRYRQAVCEKWIKDKTHIEEVLAHLSWANFDPEFSTEYEKEILSFYNRKEGKSLSLTSERSLSGAVRFLNKSPENT